MTQSGIQGLVLKSRFRFGRKPLRVHSRERGVSLLFALLFVSIFGAALASIAAFNAYHVRENEAQVTGHEMIEIAKAARLYVRDSMITDPALRTTLAAGPVRITLTTLKSKGYLPSTYGRTSGTDDLTALGQKLYVIETNWPIGGSPTSQTTVPTAFVLLRSSTKSTPVLMQEAIEVARAQNSSITAPIFNAGGTNISAKCPVTGATAAASLWDTGCLTATDFTTLMAAVPTPPAALEPGGLMIPVWKVVQPDLRAVMRFPQPENPGFATMLTDLYMGTPDDHDGTDDNNCTLAGDQVNITTTDSSGNATNTSTGLCNVISDTGAVNNRYNVSEVGNMALQRVITEAQTTDNAGTMAAETAYLGTKDDDTMHVSGNITLGNDLRVYDVKTLPTAGTLANSRFDVKNGSLEIERNAYMYSMNNTRSGLAGIAGTLQARGLVADQLTTPTFTSTTAGTYGSGNAAMNVTTLTDIQGNMSVTGGGTAELITQKLLAHKVAADDASTSINDTLRVGADITATDTTGNVQVTNTVDTHGNPTKLTGASVINNGGTNYAAVIGVLDTGGNIQVNNNMYFSDPTLTQMAVNGTRGYSAASPNVTPAGTISTTHCLADNKVANGCANRQYTPVGITP